jgi:4-amino-4-deoxy-L-arabinose transferase-like glycosyltransferase
VEYALAARNFAQHGSFFVEVDHLRLPSRYSIGFPLLMAPVYFFGGRTLTNGIHVSLALSLIQIALVYWLARRLFGDLAAAIGAALMALSPTDVELSREILSDPASNVFLIGALLAIGSSVPSEQLEARHSPSRLFLAGALFGFACVIRQPNVFLLPAYLWIVVLISLGATRSGWAHRAKSAGGLFCGGWLLLQLPLLIYNRVMFGGVLRTGYNLWLGEYGGLRNVFGFQYAFGSQRNAAHYLGMLVGKPGKYMYGESLPLYASGAFSLAALAVVLVTLAAVKANGGVRVFPRLDRSEPAQARFTAYVTWGMIAIIGLTYLEYSLYFWDAENRFVFIFAPLVAVLAGGGAAALVDYPRSLAPRWNRLRIVVVGGVFLMLFSQLAGLLPSGYWWRLNIKHQTFPADFTIHDNYAYRAMRAVAESTEPNAVIVSDQFVYVYVSSLLPDHQFFRLRQPDVLPGFVNFPIFVENPDFARSLIMAGRPVYYVGAESVFRRPRQRAHFELTEVPIRETLHIAGVQLFRISLR